MQKPMLFLSFVFVFFATCTRSLAQDRIVEVAISYDDSYAALAGDPEDRIGQIFDFLQLVYDNFDVTILPVTIRDFGSVNFSNDQVCTIAMAWTNYCDGRDIVVHFTGPLFSGALGETSGSGMCRSHTLFAETGERRCSASLIAYDPQLFSEINTTAHEIGHQLGMGHEEDNSVFCNGSLNYFMCPGGGGGSTSDPENYAISPDRREGLDRLFDLRDCHKTLDYNGPLLCEDLTGVIFGDGSINLLCGGEGDLTYHGIINGGNIHRTFEAELRVVSNTGSGNAERAVLVSPNLPVISSAPDFVRYDLGTISLAPEDLFEMDFVFNFDNLILDLTSNIDFFSLILNLEEIDPCPPDSPSCREDIQHHIAYDYAHELVGNTTVQDLLDRFEDENGFDKLFGSDVIIDGTFTVDQDIVFDEAFKFKMRDNATIIVEESLTLDRSSISPCTDERWNAVIIKNGGRLFVEHSTIEKSTVPIIVEDGGMVTLVYSTIDDALQAMTIEAGGTLSMMASKIRNAPFGLEDHGADFVRLVNNVIDVSDTGYRMTSPGYLARFDGNEFIGSTTGVHLDFEDSGLVPIDLSPASSSDANVFRNTITGIRAENAIVVVRRNTFINNFRGIEVFGSPISAIRENDLEVKHLGVLVSNSGVCFIDQRNVIHGPDNTALPNLGVFVHNVTRARVDGNDISAKWGIYSAWTDADIQNNFITIDAPTPVYGYGIYLNRNYESAISDNIIHLTDGRVGIFSNASARNAIHNNEVYGVTIDGACIQLAATTDEQVFDNIAAAAAGGHALVLVNAPNNTLECNVLSAGKNAMDISTASVLQRIVGNTLNGTNTDLTTYSELGIQRHYGNVFDGGEVVANLSDPEITGSRFFVDSDENSRYLPQNINALDWFINEDDNGQTLICSGTPGAGNFYWADNPDLLCTYLELLDKLPEQDLFEAYFIRYFHLLRSMHAHMDVQDWPDCFRNAMDTLAVCGLNALVESDQWLADFVRPADSSTAAQFTTLDSLVTAIGATFDSEDSLANAQLAVLDALLGGIDSYKSSVLDQAESKIDSIDCDSTIVSHWEEALEWTIADLSGDSAARNAASLEDIAHLCAQAYGDGVHWARGVLAAFSTARFDANDGCVGPPVHPRLKRGDTCDIRIYPNPAPYTLSIKGLPDQAVNVRIFDASGRSVREVPNYRDGDGIRLDNMVAGVYLVEVRTAEGLLLAAEKFVLSDK